jgi:signal transduction histidine kinase/CheY-like chemotaxis protein
VSGIWQQTEDAGHSGALALVASVCAALAEQRPVNAIEALLAQGALRLLDAAVFAVIDLERGGRELRVAQVAAVAEAAAAARGRRFPRAGTLVHRALAEEAPVRLAAPVPFAPDGLLLALTAGDELRNAVAVPVRRAGVGVGALVAVNLRAGVDERALELLRLLADLQAIVSNQGRSAAEPEGEGRISAEEKQQSLSRTRWLAALGEVAAGVAHDINNALNPIVAFAELIRARPDDPENVRVFAERILMAARDGAETVRRIQSFTQRRPDTSRRTTVSLTSLVREAVELVRPVLDLRSAGGPVRIEESVGEDLLVHANAIELREALLNLMLNAVDAMPDGGMLRLVGRREEDHVVLAVQDTGVGMTREVLKRAPEPFFTTKGPRGTGLGLSQVAGIVRRHGGSMELESWPGVGTTVLLRLPLAPPVAERANPPPGILLVDDNPLSLEAMAATLRSGGFHVVTASSGEAAVAAFEPGRYRAVLTDLGLPGLDGWELVERLRAMDPAVRVGVITGTSLERVGDEVKRHRVDLFFTKPVDPERLLAAL